MKIMALHPATKVASITFAQGRVTNLEETEQEKLI
jgi:hypothetical protein